MAGAVWYCAQNASAAYLSGQIVTDSRNPEDLRRLLMDALPDFQSRGEVQHFLTDYGDEETYTLP